MLKGLYGPGYSEFGYLPGVPIRDDSTFSILQSSSCAGPVIRQEAGSFVVVLLPVTTVDRPPGAAFGQTDRDVELLDVPDVRQRRFGETQDGERAARCRLSPAARLAGALRSPGGGRPRRWRRSRGRQGGPSRLRPPLRLGPWPGGPWLWPSPWRVRGSLGVVGDRR